MPDRPAPVDRILSAWARGHGTAWIIENIRRPDGQKYYYGTVQSIVTAARKAGDPRAVYRRRKGGN